jgi:hypothetical protein
MMTALLHPLLVALQSERHFRLPLARTVLHELSGCEETPELVAILAEVRGMLVDAPRADLGDFARLEETRDPGPLVVVLRR